MAIIPTFTAPVGDALTGDRLRSGVDSQVAEKPMWGFAQAWPEDRRTRFVAILPRSGVVMRPPPLTSATIPGDPYLYGLGGDEHTIWMCDLTQDRIWKLHPTTFAVETFREAPHPPTGTSAHSVGGDSTTVWFLNFYPRYGLPNWPPQAHDIYTLYRLDGTEADLPVVRSTPFRYVQSIDGDSTVAWAIHKDINTGDGLAVEYETAELIRIAPDLTIKDSIPAPLRSRGHWATAIAGSKDNLYLHTYHPIREESWLHELSVTTYEIIRSYGPFVSRWALADIGAN